MGVDKKMLSVLQSWKWKLLSTYKHAQMNDMLLKQQKDGVGFVVWV